MSFISVTKVTLKETDWTLSKLFNDTDESVALSSCLFLSGDIFRQVSDKVMRQSLHKGVPPLFVSFRSLYTDPEKVGGPWNTW